MKTRTGCHRVIKQDVPLFGGEPAKQGRYDRIHRTIHNWIRRTESDKDDQPVQMNGRWRGRRDVGVRQFGFETPSPSPMKRVSLRVGSAPAPSAVLLMTSPHHSGAPLA